MSVRGWSISMAILAALSAGATTARAADDEELSATLRAVVEKNLDAYDVDDLDATAKTVHTRSPAYEASKAAAAEQVKDLDVDTQLVDFRYIGHDDEFAVARAKKKTTAKPGETDFTDNTIDVIVLFHMEDGVWKLWSEQVLGVDLAPK
jgi:hypothetical protein